MVNTNILKSKSSFHEGFIMIHQAKLKIHQKSKVTKLVFSLGEVNWTLTKHNFYMLHQKILNKRSYWRKFNSLQLWLSKLKSKNASFERYEPKHYKSFQKSTKDTFCQSNLHQVKNFKWKNYPHESCRGHLELSKKYKITFIW